MRVVFQERLWTIVGYYWMHTLLRAEDGEQIYVDEDDLVNWGPTNEEIQQEGVR